MTTTICQQCSTAFRVLPARVARHAKHFCTDHCRLAYVQDAATRFWEKVAISTFHDCWPWIGSRNNKGYGQVRIQKHCVLAHRFAFEFMWEPLGPERLALHRCDNPPCCNPWHLFAGTHKDNAQDMLAKARDYRGIPVHGEQHPFAKLSTAAVTEIKRLYGTDMVSRQQLAVRFAVTYQHIDHIVKGRLRKHA